MTKSVGVALGGGGAKGLAHVAILQTLDDMGIEISALAGTSIGAIIGSAYASGKTANELRAALDKLLARSAVDKWRLSASSVGWPR